MIDLTICNLAVGLVGGGRPLKSVDDQTPEAVACKSFFRLALDETITSSNWSFTRRDEIITEDDMLKNEHGQVIAGATLPYSYTYQLPGDLIKVIYLARYSSRPRTIETMAVQHGDLIPFNFRNIDDKLYIAVDFPPPLELHYQCRIKNFSIVSSGFNHACATKLASLIAPAIIGGAEGIELGIALEKKFMETMTRAAAIDAQQGAYSLTTSRTNRFIEARK